MVCLVCWFHGGVVKENREFENMKDVTRMFEVAPCLHEIVECARSHSSYGVDDEISLKGRVDCGRGRAAYALVDLKTDVEWDQFKRLAEQASVSYLDVVVTSRKTAGRELGIGVIQQEQMQSKGTECADNSDSKTFSFDEIEPGTAHDYFPNDVFEMEEAEEDDDDISEGYNGGDDNDGYDNDGYESEGEELEKDSAPPLGDNHHVVPPPVPTNLCPPHDDDTFVRHMADGAHKRGSVTYTARELDLLKQCHVEIPHVANDKDISRVDRAICETTLVHAEDECLPQYETSEIEGKKNLIPLRTSSFSWLTIRLDFIDLSPLFTLTRTRGMKSCASKGACGVFSVARCVAQRSGRLQELSNLMSVVPLSQVGWRGRG
ncbi:hypothetical protein HU200_067724 [Digitaria exilis]|uniref:Uncharacterized protein n=1 Tax=Digitaria exilis TaxID=1010633 RepID=A0A835A4N2_9POAL|nr:hypothetical protein HU200_067724 [Digitaria exilis]